MEIFKNSLVYNHICNNHSHLCALLATLALCHAVQFQHLLRNVAHHHLQRVVRHIRLRLRMIHRVQIPTIVLQRAHTIGATV